MHRCMSSASVFEASSLWHTARVATRRARHDAEATLVPSEDSKTHHTTAGASSRSLTVSTAIAALRRKMAGVVSLRAMPTGNREGMGAEGRRALRSCCARREIHAEPSLPQPPPPASVIV